MAYKSIVKEPEGMRAVILDFTFACLTEQPSDIINFGVEFFTKLQKQRHTAIISDTKYAPRSSKVKQLEKIKSPETISFKSETISFKSQDEIIYMPQNDAPTIVPVRTRRKSVYAERYNPETDSENEENIKLVPPKSDEQRARLNDSVKNILIFQTLDQEQINELLDAMFEKKVEPNEIVIRQGDDGDNFYIIESGIFKAFIGDDKNHVKIYENNGSFGELALMYNTARAATIKAETKGILWALDRQTFRRIVLKSAYKKRMMYEQFLNTVPLLANLEKYERANIIDAIVPQTFTKGERIIKQGDAASGMFFIEDGTVSVRMKKGNKEVEISTLESGAYFGELALITKKPRAASVYAIDDVKIAFLDVGAFERLLGPCMEIMKRNVVDYEQQLINIFGRTSNIPDIR